MVVISEDLRLEGHRVEVIPAYEVQSCSDVRKRMDFYACSFFFSFLVFFLYLSCIYSCSQVRARCSYDSDGSAVSSGQFESSGSSLLIAHHDWSFRCPCHVNWPPYVTIKERKLKYKTNHFLNFQQREGDICRDQSSFVLRLWTVFFSFLSFFFFFFNDGTTGIGGRYYSASLHVSKNCDNFQVSWTWTHSVKFSAIKKVISDVDCAISKKKKKKPAFVGLIHVSSFTTGSPLQKQQEKVKSQQLKQDCI